MRRDFAVLLAAALLAALAVATPGCDELRPRVLAPADASPAAASGVVPLALDLGLGRPPQAGESFRVLVDTGEYGAPERTTDVTARLAVDAAGLATGELGPADLEPGPSVVRLEVVADGRTRGARARFSWEPELAADPGPCDPLDPRACLLPFPSDFFSVADASTDSGRRLAIDRSAMPRNNFGVHADPSGYDRADGFSVGSPILTHVPGLDLARSDAPPLTDVPRSLDPDGPLLLVDADTYERIPAWMELDDDVHAPLPGDKALIIRPGINYREGHRYIVALRRLRDANGASLEPRRLFRVYRDGIPTWIPHVEARRAHMEQLFQRLAEAGFGRQDLYLAWDFTVQSTRSVAEDLLHMRDDAFAALGDQAPAYRVTEDVSYTPAENADILREIAGSFDVPLYLTGDGSPGNRLNRGPDGLPVRNGTWQAPFRCRIPRWVEPSPGVVRQARPSLYGHGLLGSEDEVRASHVAAMANEYGFVFCATPWAGMAEEDVGNALAILLDFSGFPSLPERLHQGQLNQLFLARLLRHPEGFAADPAFQIGGTPVFDHREVYYDGNSQGGIEAGALAAISQDVTRFVMGVPGMNYSMLLKRSLDFDPFNDLLSQVYRDPIDRELLTALAEILWERVESNGHARHMIDDPYPDTPPKHILLQVAFADHQVSMWTAEIWARTMGAHAALPPVRHPDVEPLWGIEPIREYPFDGSALVYWDAGNPPPPVSNVPPREGPPVPGLAGCAVRRHQDPHECPRREPEARLQKSLFLAPEGVVADTCGGQPCTVQNGD